MMYHLPSKEECDKIVAENEAFYRADRVVEGQNVAIYDYRLASLSDFEDYQAYELRGICFVQNSKGIWERNLLMNKFFNINQCEGKDIVKVFADKEKTELLYEGPVETQDYVDAMGFTPKLIGPPKRYVDVVGKTPSWMYDDVKDKKIVNLANKEDGSIISFVKFENGKIRAKSKTSFISDQALMAQEIFDNNVHLSCFVTGCIETGFTPIFELVGPENQIVLEYQNTELILLQIRDKKGKYVDDIDNFSLNYDIKVAEHFPESMMNLDDLLARKEIDKSDIEGWIVTFEDGQMAKIKTDKYLSLHGLIGPDAFRENLLIKTILDGNIDDVISALVPGEKKDKIVALDKKVTHKFNHLVVEFKELRRKYFQDFEEDRKRFAIKHSKDEMFGGVMRTLNTSFRDVEKDAEGKVKEYILKRCNGLGDAKKWLASIEEVI